MHPAYAWHKIAIFVVVTVFGLLLNYHVFWEPSRQGFFITQDILYPDLDDTVSTTSLTFFSLIGPGLIMIGWELSKKRKGMAFAIIAEFLFFWSLCLFATQVLKNVAGRHRPYFLAACDPDMSSIDITDATKYYTRSICRGDRVEIDEASLSLPSGHASAGAYGLGALIVYIHYIIGDSLSLSWLRPTAEICLVLIQGFNSLSRTTDHKHWYTDILAGNLIGLFFVFYGFYPFVKRELYAQLKSEEDERQEVGSVDSLELGSR